MNANQVISLASLIDQEHFLGVEDLQKEIIKNPNDFKMIMNGSKPQWVYLSFEDRKKITAQNTGALEKTFTPSSQKVSLRKEAADSKIKQVVKTTTSKSVKKMKPLSRDI